MKTALLSHFQKKLPGAPNNVPQKKRTPISLPDPGKPLPLPPIIERRLRSVASRVVRVAWMEGLLWLVASASVLVLVQGGADWLFDLSRGRRFFLLVGDAGIFSWLVWRYLVTPWRQRLTLEQSALRTERRWPDWSTSLISAVQLSKRPEGARGLVEELIGKVARRAESMDFRAAVDASHLRRLAIRALALLLVLTAAVAWQWPRSLVILKRIALSNIPLPTQSIVISISGDISIPAGGSIDLSARVEGVIPRTGRVVITYEGKKSQSVPITPRPASPDVFSLTVPNVQQPLSYRFYLNDGRGPEFKVALYHGPMLEALSFEQIPPAYTGLPKAQLTAGNLSVLAGSRLHIEGRSNQPLKSGQAAITGGAQPVELKIGPDGKKVSAEVLIPVKDFEGFSIVLQNTGGVASQDNTFYKVQIVPDKAPEIKFAPGQPDLVTFVETSHPRLRFEAADDFQVRKVFLCTQVSDGDEDAEKPADSKVVKIPIDVPQPAGRLIFDYDWKNPAASVEWKAGTKLNYWIEAVDNNDVTGPGIGRSPVRKWEVVSAEAKREELSGKLHKHAELIEDLSRTQQQLQQSVGELIRKEGSVK